MLRSGKAAIDRDLIGQIKSLQARRVETGGSARDAVRRVNLRRNISPLGHPDLIPRRCGVERILQAYKSGLPRSAGWRGAVASRIHIDCTGVCIASRNYSVRAISNTRHFVIVFICFFLSSLFSGVSGAEVCRIFPEQEFLEAIWLIGWLCERALWLRSL